MQRRTLSHMMAASLLTLATAALGQQSGQPAQQPAQPQSAQDSYQGVSQPPTDPITTSPDAPPPPKPSAAVAVTPQQPQPTSYGPANPVGPVGGGGASYGSPNPPQQSLSGRPAYVDPDGDMVQPRAARPGELLEGATIRVKLLDRISSSETEKGEPFHGQVALDVLQDGKVLIPAGSTIEGRVSAVSSGHFAGHGSLRLRPDAVILPDGSRYLLHAETTGTQGSKTRMGAEGTINPGSRAKKDGIEYGAVVGTGAIAGAVVGGPVGALTGSLIGAGVVTTHLMVDHPQATLEPGTILLFSTTEPMNLLPTAN